MKDIISKIKIVEKRQEDVEALRKLFLEVRQQTFFWRDAKEFTLLDFDRETEGELVLVARSDNELAGFISIWLADSFIHHLYVDEKYRSFGVGTNLINAVIERIGLPLRLKCVENNTKAIAFYAKRGFREKGRGLSDDDAYIMLELQRS
jgi:ribosomal protein S18 acetylase RimI-like enzyme